ncbi:helix-turn-helix transcriptional regulator [Magnetospirillum fulvum]|nr:LuxR C-terminal-related transcriptional regulator [Magnetospirillum fulvum]
MRRPSQPPFDAVDLTRMKILAPHINRAMRLFVQSSAGDRQCRAAFAALDHIAPALAVLEGSGHVVYRNDKMLALAREGDVSILNGRVHARSPQIRARLLTAVQDCHQAVLGGRSHLSRAIAVPRSPERSPLAVLVGSARSDVCGDASASPLVVLLVTDPDACHEIQRSALSELYGMTGAEADVAGMLAEGFSPDEIARELAISLNTVRTHMKRAFEKTRVGRQADLVRVLLTSPVHSPGPLGPGEDGSGST